MKTETNYNINNKYFKSKPAEFTKNKIISGEIINIENGITTVLFDKKSLNFKSEEIVGDLGNRVNFKVISSDNNSIKLKQILDTPSNITLKKQSLESIAQLFKKNNFIKDDKKEDEALKIFKNKLSYSENNINKNIINQLVASGLSLDKIDISMLTKAIKEFEDVKKITPDKNINDETINNLLSEHASATRKNMNLINANMKNFESAKNISKEGILKLIKDEKPITIENLHIYKFSSLDENKNSDEDFFNIKPQIDKLLSEISENNEENQKISKLFFENNIPINKTNLEKFRFLNNLENNISKQDVISASVSAIKKDSKIMDLFEFHQINNIFESNYSAMNNLSYIEVSDIQNLIDTQTPVNINNLVNQNSQNNNIKSEALEIKKTLADIQLKLSAESCYRLADKKIDINFLPVKKVLEELNILEKENYIKNLNLMDTKVTEKNISSIYNLFQKTNNFIFINHLTYKDILFKKTPFTIKGINESILKNYDVFQTKIDTRYGDSINKTDMEKYLKDLGLTGSESDKKALKILAKNNTDATYENILKVKAIDQKINEISENLKPNIVAKMLKDNIDPTNIHIDEVLEYIDKFNEIYGETDNDKIINDILKMDNDKNIPQETKDYIIAVYRMINKIQKNAGFITDNLTMKNLFDTSSYLDKTNLKNSLIDVNISDEFGFAERKIIPEKNIHNILEKMNLGKTDFNIKTAQEIMMIEENISEQVLSEKINKAYLNKTELIKMADILSPENLENYKSDIAIEILNEQNINYKRKKTDNNYNILTHEEVTDEMITFFKENDIDENIINIKAFNHLKNNSNVIPEILNELNVNIQNDKIFNNIDIEIKDIKSKQAVELLNFQNFINKSNSNSNYTVPVKIGDKIENLNMFILDNNIDKKDTLNILMSLNTENLGTLKFDININNKDVDIKIISEKDLDTKELENLINESDFILNSVELEKGDDWNK